MVSGRVYSDSIVKLAVNAYYNIQPTVSLVIEEANPRNISASKISRYTVCMFKVCMVYYLVCVTYERPSPDHPCAGRAGWDRLHHLFLMTADKCGWREVLLSKQIGPHL